MNYAPEALFGWALLYLLLLFLLAYATDRGWIPERWTGHPMVYALSLGVYATSWSYYGSVGFAQHAGFLYLAIFIGPTLAFLFWPQLLRPILRLTREYQLGSLADLFAFRYRSQAAGILVTLFMLVGSLPYLALQVRAVAESAQALTDQGTPHSVALWFCAILILFATLFGVRQDAPRAKHQGLVAAIAFESLVKLLALLAVGASALFGTFGGLKDLECWLEMHPQALASLYEPMREGPWSTLLFLSFAASFLLPRQFHMAFAENVQPRALGYAAWAFPLFLLLLNLAIPPILWAGMRLNLQMDPDYYVLGVTLGHPWLAVLTFIGGISAASAMVIVTTLALASMSLNHLVLPVRYIDFLRLPFRHRGEGADTISSIPSHPQRWREQEPGVDLYRWVVWAQRLLIASIILAGYGFYLLLEHHKGLAQLGLISFVAVAQFVPGLVGVLFWPRATRAGFLAGLAGGILVWSLTLLAPVLRHAGFDPDMDGIPHPMGMAHWEFETFLSLLINSVLFIVFSLLTRPTPEEAKAARACRSDAAPALTGVVAARSPQAFVEVLAGIIGAETARREVTQALADLGLGEDEQHPAELRKLRERIERNLSGLMGPRMAQAIVDEGLELDGAAKLALADSVRYLEERLEESRSQLRGVAADLDELRRFQRRILLDLPLGACAVEADQRVVIWNLALEKISGVPSEEATGRPLTELPAPWREVLGGFALAGDEHVHHLELTLPAGSRWLNLHKAMLVEPGEMPQPKGSRHGMVMLVEDLTDMETLEAELAHSDRLASIGRLAAGVAHEIGNPVTGIASLAQNLRDERDPGAVRESAEAIVQQTQRVTRIIRSLMNFSRSGAAPVTPQPFLLAEVIDEAISLVRLSHHGSKVECSHGCPPDLQLSGDRQQLSQVLVNLLANACDASKPGDRIELLAYRDEDEVRIEVLDQGTGIPEHLRERIFAPFFTTKQPGEGTGLGLTLAEKMVREQGGRIEIDSAPGVGTRVVVTFPVSP